MSESGAGVAPVRLLVLTSIVAPYRVPLFNELAATDGIELRVLYLAAVVPPRRWNVPWSDIRHDFRVLPEVFRFRRGQTTVHVNRGVRRELRAWAPDVVIVGGWDQPAYLWVTLLRRRYGYRLGCFVESTATDRRDAGRWAERVKRRVVRDSDVIVVPGSASRSYAIDLGADDARIVTAPNSIDTARFAHAAERDVKEPVRVLFVGRLEESKGVDVLLAAAEALPPGVVIELVGTGPLEGDARRASARGAAIVVSGHLDGADLVTAYAGADVFVFPSKSDPWGLVVNEAMASGLPIVTTPAPGAVADLVVDGDNGFIVAVGDPLALAAALTELAQDPVRRRSMGGRSLERIAAFTPRAAADGFADAGRTAMKTGVR